MPGQLTIRLPDSIIEELNGIAKKEKVTRATVIRQCLEIGLSELSHAHSRDVSTLIRESQSEILAAIQKLETLLGSTQFETEGHASTSAHQTQPTSIKPKSNVSTRIEFETDAPAFEVVDTDDEAGRDATLVTARPVTPSVQRNASNFYLDAHGQVRTDRRKTLGNRSSGPEQRVGARLRYVREVKGWTIQDMAEALNITADLMADIESGRRGLPGSRALRAEAKLQQWEATVTESSALEQSDV